MSIQRYRNDNPRSADEIADAIEFELVQINESIPVTPGTQNYAYVNSFAATLAEQQEESLNQLYDAAYITDAEDEELTKKAGEVGVDRQDAVAATGVVEVTRSSPADTDRIAPSGTRVSTGGEDPIVFELTEPATISSDYTDTDSTNYTTTSTSFTTQTSFDVNCEYRSSFSVGADIANSNSSYTAELDIVDANNGVTIASYSTTNTSLTSFGPTSYDVSAIDTTITVKFKLRTTNSSGTAELDNSTVDVQGQTGAVANAICTETGPSGNIGAKTVNVFIDKPAGITDVTNPEPIGNIAYTLTDGQTQLTAGQEEENDEGLRQRTLDSTAIGGAGTAAAAALALENIEDVISADVKTNRSDSVVDNIDPWHTEVRVYGGNMATIADTLYETLPLATLKSLHGGANGTLDSETINRSDLYGDLTIEITRPTEIDLSITVDLVHDASYAGTTDVKNAIVQYIGGTTTDARTIPGLGQGDNVIVNKAENAAEDVAGVEAVTDMIIDDNNDGTDDTTTDSDGVQVYTVTNAEVPVVSANDITVNETPR